MDMMYTPDFWVAVGQIIMIDILLGGDNAVVIALACRRLPPKQRAQGILWGTAGAIVLRIVLIFFALTLLAIPFLKIVGALLLVWIGIKLLVPEHGEGHVNIEGSDRLWGAVKTVIIADFVMSLDNVIAIAGAAETAGGGKHSMALVIFGVLVSIPIIVWGSQMVIKLMDRFPLIITLGGMLLGWIAGTMIVTDPALTNPDIVKQMPKLVPTDLVRYGAGAAGALFVLLMGKWLASRQAPEPQAASAAATTAPSGALRRLLLAVDGSEASAGVVRQALALHTQIPGPPALELHLVNVQRPLTGDVSRFVAAESVQDYYKERSEQALAPGRSALNAAGVSFTEHALEGDPGTAIAEAARTLGCDLIVMGARGLTSNTAVLLGSVAQSTIENAATPVLVVK